MTVEVKIHRVLKIHMEKSKSHKLQKEYYIIFLFATIVFVNFENTNIIKLITGQIRILINIRLKLSKKLLEIPMKEQIFSYVTFGRKVFREYPLAYCKE